MDTQKLPNGLVRLPAYFIQTIGADCQIQQMPSNLLRALLRLGARGYATPPILLSLIFRVTKLMWKHYLGRHCWMAQIQTTLTTIGAILVTWISGLWKVPILL